MQSIAETIRDVLDSIGDWATVKDVRREIKRQNIELPQFQGRLGNFLYKAVIQGFAEKRKTDSLIEYRLLPERKVPDKYIAEKKARNKLLSDRRKEERARLRLIKNEKRSIMTDRPYSFEVHMICQRRWSQ